ncbi:MAG: DNA-3-methyladenine glycosylase I [Pseudomonadota bacterium]
MERCAWGTTDETYILYHDREWGVPVHDDARLFEMLILEGAQAGLSWITILKRREAYREVFDRFDPVSIAGWDDQRIEALTRNRAIIRNRLKIRSARTNARAFLSVVEEMESFDAFIWSFVGGEPIQNAWSSMDQVPAQTPESQSMSRALKKKGFSFVGPTICYAYMQSVGMVNDHLVTCFRYAQLSPSLTALT